MDLSVSKVSYSIAEVSNEDLALIQVRSLLTVFLGVLKEWVYRRSQLKETSMED